MAYKKMYKIGTVVWFLPWNALGKAPMLDVVVGHNNFDCYKLDNLGLYVHRTFVVPNTRFFRRLYGLES